jgi:cytochrome c oxidase assembly protein subunit 11
MKSRALYCCAGFGGTTQIASRAKTERMKPVEGGRLITVTFDGTVADTMPWQFRQSQRSLKVVPGETALAFYTARNPTDKHITGVATYNVFPLKAGELTFSLLALIRQSVNFSSCLL